MTSQKGLHMIDDGFAGAFVAGLALTLLLMLWLLLERAL